MRMLISTLLIAGLLAATVAVALVLHDGAVAGIRDDERDDARRATQELDKTLQATAFRLRGVAGLFEASQSVSASEFHAFATPLFAEERALNAVIWMPRITDPRRGAYERANVPITEGPPDARRRAARRPTYFPVTYLETESSRRALGFDAASDPLRLDTVRRAIMRSRSVATAPVTLASSGKPGILLYQPVFAGNVVPTSRAERARAVQGVVAGSYRLDALLGSLSRSVPGSTTLQVRENDELISGPRRLEGAETERVAVAGRTWTVRASSNRSPSPVVPAAVLLAGGALALLVALALRQAFTRERYALAMVEERMRERDRAQGELEGARATAERLADEQAALRRIATSIAGEEPLDAIRATILSELKRLYGAEDAAVVRHSDGRLLSPSQPDWLADRADASVVRYEMRIGRSTTGTVALLNPTRREGIQERLHDFGELASVAVMNAEARRELAVRASTDGLTGLLNRRAFDERLAGEVDRAVRHGRDLVLAIIDIDHFKRVNDRHGHLAGDAVLTDVARQLSVLARRGDAVARIGGEEFAWIMPETRIATAFDVAERVRTAIAATDHADTTDLTISVGLSDLGTALTGDALYACADTALYHAKRTGRNRTVPHDPALGLSTAS